MTNTRGLASFDPVAGRRGRQVRRCALLVLVVACWLGGCAGQRQHFQALAPGAQSIVDIRETLVLMPLRVWPLQANLKLSGMQLVDTASGDLHQLVFFADESLGSRDLPLRKLQYETAQTAVLDLPPGNYRLAALDLAFPWQKSSAGIARFEPEVELVLPVGSQPAYAGRLTVEIEVLTVSDDFGARRYEFPLTEPVRLYSIDLQLEVTARVRIDDRLQQDRADAVLAFPGLADVVFEKSLFR
ncbi:MAG: hypothetical protein QNJ85_09045 [Gammaproteobacteria bacterium]|nr:hypothetical protein [Gammaproteobacteria bacterium]